MIRLFFYHSLMETLETFIYFMIHRNEFVAVPGLEFIQSLVELTGSEEAAASVLRGMVRLGADTSIIKYEMTPQAVRRSYVGAAPVVWSVRARAAVIWRGLVRGLERRC